MRSAAWSLVAGSVFVACAPDTAAPPAAAPAASEPSTSAPTSAPTAIAATHPAAVAASPAQDPPKRGRLSIDQARRYMVELINRDRASAGLAKVELDEAAPTRSGQAHAEDMAKHGYLGHWGTDGSVPEQRFTDAGGTGMVMENASCYTDQKTRVLDTAPGIDPKNVEEAESMFFHEQPPRDGHRQNILKAWHTKVGIGVAQPVATPTEIPVPCFSQEFLDDYGTYAPAPKHLRLGGTVHVEGSLSAPAKFAGVGLARVDAPKPLAVSDLNQRRSYAIPKPYEMYWPPGFQTPIPVVVHGNAFSVDLPASDGGKAGMYELSVWANVPGTAELVMVSLRTILVP
jgi:uncharacterized protein YkwD